MVKDKSASTAAAKWAACTSASWPVGHARSEKDHTGYLEMAKEEQKQPVERERKARFHPIFFTARSVTDYKFG